MNSEWAQGRVISLPMYPEISEEQIGHITKEVDFIIYGGIELAVNDESLG